MRNLLALIALLAILFAAVGGWRGWYTVHWVSGGLGRATFLVEVDAYRCGGDLLDAGRATAAALGKLFTRREQQTAQE